MRYSFILILFAVLNFNTSFSQAYIPFIEGDKMWTVNSAPSINPYNQHIVIGTFGNDTIIDSIQYKMIIEQWISSNYISYIREDTIEKKVYCKMAPNQCEFLLYDFNLQVGDTFYNETTDTSCTTDLSYMIVQSVTIDFFAENNRIKIVLDYFGFDVIWYEGVGSLSDGIFSPFGWVGSYNYLQCYFEDSVLLYHNTSLSSDCFVYSEPLSYDKQEFKVQINDQELIITTNSQSEFYIDLFDITGRKRIAGKYKGNTKIDLSELSNGIYIYNILGDEPGYRVSGKVFVSE